MLIDGAVRLPQQQAETCALVGWTHFGMITASLRWLWGAILGLCVDQTVKPRYGQPGTDLHEQRSALTPSSNLK